MTETRGQRETVSLEVSEPDIVPAMSGDRRMIARTLKALLHNAFKFTREGTVTLSLEIDGERVRYAVTDTGIGIPPESQRVVFEEFRQLDGTKTREFGGSGLGLTLARRLAQLVHGEITLLSEPGAGSTFKLELPLQYETQGQS